jgi:hypothetical protein
MTWAIDASNAITNRESSACSRKTPAGNITFFLSLRMGLRIINGYPGASDFNKDRRYLNQDSDKGSDKGSCNAGAMYS